MEITPGPKVKLDSKDKLILTELQLNARQSIAQIAKKTKLPRDVVVYRIKRLEELKVIRGHHTVLNHSRLGHPLFAYVFFSSYNLEPEKEKKFINYLSAQKNIVYVAKNSGEFDYTIGVCAKDYMQFDEILREIRQKFISVIKEFKITPVIQEYKFDMMYNLI
tara:strand:+ start:1223 stop:1711 length:489 start_codon:yes stop_codon:yes gene_type:complete